MGDDIGGSILGFLDVLLPCTQCHAAGNNNQSRDIGNGHNTVFAALTLLLLVESILSWTTKKGSRSKQCVRKIHGLSPVLGMCVLVVSKNEVVVCRCVA